MSDEELRLECLKLVLNHRGLGGGADKVITEARKLSDFVIGAKDAEIISAAHDLADKIKS